MQSEAIFQSELSDKLTMPSVSAVLINKEFFLHRCQPKRHLLSDLWLAFGTFGGCQNAHWLLRQRELDDYGFFKNFFNIKVFFGFALWRFIDATTEQ